MNQAAMRITASLLLWYLLSAVSEGAGDGPTRAWDLSLIPHSSSQLVGVIISLPVKYYRPVVSE